MNEHPEEMPNPLNPNPGVTPEPNNPPLDANPSEPMPPVETIEVAAETVTVGPAPVENSTSVDPMARPMEKAPVPETTTPPKKKKTGLIIGIIVAAVALIGGIVAAIVIMNLNKGDAVEKAISKIVNGETPANVAIDGNFMITPNDEESPISSLEIKLDSEASTSSMLNSTVAKVTANFQDAGSVSFEFDEVYAANGDLYFRLDGATDAIEDYTQLMQNAMMNGAAGIDTLNCEADENGETNCVEAGCEEDEFGNVVCTGDETTTDVDCVDGEDCASETTTEVTTNGAEDLLGSISGFAGIIEVVDGEWLRISVDELSQMSDGLMQSDMSCLVNFVGDINNYSNSVAEMYSKNPFISSTTEGVTLASKGGTPVYRVMIDDENFSNFVNAVQNSSLADNLYSCMGYDNATINTDNVVAEIDNLPDLYVEVDDEYNFTRLYFTSNIGDGEATLTTDLGFSYPENINIAEPVEYKDFSDIIQEIFTSMYMGLPVGVEEGVVVEGQN